MLPIAPSTYYAHAARRSDPELRSARAKTDEALMPEIRRVGRELPGLWCASALAADAAGAVRCCALHRAASDEAPGPARCHPRQGGAHDGERCEGAVPARSRQQAVHFGSAKRVVGLGLHRCVDVARLDLRRLRHRRIRTPDRGLEGVAVDADRAGARCARAGAACEEAGRIGACDPPQRPGCAVRLDPLHRAARRGRPGALGGVWATRKTTHWPRPSTACARPR